MQKFWNFKVNLFSWIFYSFNLRYPKRGFDRFLKRTVCLETNWREIRWIIFLVLGLSIRSPKSKMASITIELNSWRNFCLFGISVVQRSFGCSSLHESVEFRSQPPIPVVNTRSEIRFYYDLTSKKETFFLFISKFKKEWEKPSCRVSKYHFLCLLVGCIDSLL